MGDRHAADRLLPLVYDELRRSARERLGELYNRADYPESLVGWFDVTWDYPSVEPPEMAQTKR